MICSFHIRSQLGFGVFIVQGFRGTLKYIYNVYSHSFGDLEANKNLCIYWVKVFHLFMRNCVLQIRVYELLVPCLSRSLSQTHPSFITFLTSKCSRGQLELLMCKEDWRSRSVPVNPTSESSSSVEKIYEDVIIQPSRMCLVSIAEVSAIGCL